MTKFSPYFPFTLHCFYTKISSFMRVLTIGIFRDCFYLLIFYSEKFSTWVWRLPFTVNVNLNLSIGKNYPKLLPILSQDRKTLSQNSQHFPILGIARALLCYLLMVDVLSLLKYFRVIFVLKINYWLHSDELNIQASKFYDLITTFMRGNIVVNDLMFALFCRQSWYNICEHGN